MLMFRSTFHGRAASRRSCKSPVAKGKKRLKVESSQSDGIASSSSADESDIGAEIIEGVERVHVCPQLDAKTLSVGRIFMRYLEEGWSRGTIVAYRPKKIRSNVTAHFDDEEESANRDMLLKADEYLTGKLEDAIVGS